MTGDLPVEFINFFCGNPQFLILRAANSMLFKLTDIFVLHLELGHIARELSVLGIPAGSGLPGIFQLKDRIKDRLLRQARRKGFHAAVINQHQFLQTNGTIQNHILILSAFVYNTTCLPGSARSISACAQAGGPSTRVCPLMDARGHSAAPEALTCTRTKCTSRKNPELAETSKLQPPSYPSIEELFENKRYRR